MSVLDADGLYNANFTPDEVGMYTLQSVFTPVTVPAFTILGREALGVANRASGDRGAYTSLHNNKSMRVRSIYQNYVYNIASMLTLAYVCYV